MLLNSWQPACATGGAHDGAVQPTSWTCPPASDIYRAGRCWQARLARYSKLMSDLPPPAIETRATVPALPADLQLLIDAAVADGDDQTIAKLLGYARLVDEWVAAIGLDPALFGTHSLRRTKASLIYKRTGNLRAVQILLGHRKIESTVRYLGVDLEDALALSEGTDV